MVGNPPVNAGDTGSILGLGKSHVPQSSWARVPQLLSLHSRACKPQLLSPSATAAETRAPRVHARNGRSHLWEARAPWQQGPNAAKNKVNKLSLKKNYYQIHVLVWQVLEVFINSCYSLKTLKSRMHYEKSVKHLKTLIIFL